MSKHFGDGVGQGGGGESLIVCHLWRDNSKTLERGTRKDWARKEGRGKRNRIRKTEDRERGTGKKGTENERDLLFICYHYFQQKHSLSH